MCVIVTPASDFVWQGSFGRAVACVSVAGPIAPRYVGPFTDARMKPTLSTPRLTLRAFLAVDLPFLLELDADPRVRRYVDLAVPPSMEDVRSYTARWHEWDTTRPTLGYWVAEVEGRFVGWFHLRPPRGDTPREPDDQELGYRLRPDAWGRGIATEGSRLLLRHAFETVGAPRVTAAALVENRASTRVMEKVGMARVVDWAYTAKDGSLVPAVLYAIARERG
jgi:RimJ/RimL family protein N-acetyltransferase